MQRGPFSRIDYQKKTPLSQKKKIHPSDKKREKFNAGARTWQDKVQYGINNIGKKVKGAARHQRQRGRVIQKVGR